MISRAWLCAITFVLPLTAYAAASSSSADLAATILSKMAQPAPAQTPFVQVSYQGMLDRPLVVSGQMKWLGGDSLERDVEQPYQETAKIGAGELSVQRGNSAVRRIPVSRAPQMGAILAGFRALLGGNAALLSQDFDVAAQGNRTAWVLTMRPRAQASKSHVQSIVIDGRGNAPRCMTLSEADGDTTITLLGAMAKAGLPSAAPQQSALAALCRNG
ncbi:MAG: LolA-related protein [Rhodanobacteraceae bacterium]|nr:outer membrane lipoprotein carrier protein LolA [Pseudomonadota bacterium]